MAGGGGGEQDLNLVPYMDIMVNLIMFMLVVTAYIIELREAPVLAPSYGPGPSDPTAQEKPKPYLTVAISTKGFALLGSGGDVPAAEITRAGDKYPYGELTEALRNYKNQYTLAENLVITADGAVPYSALVATMDAARSDADGPLFPGVTLGLAVAGR